MLEFQFFGPYYIKVGILILGGTAIVALLLFLNRKDQRRLEKSK